MSIPATTPMMRHVDAGLDRLQRDREHALAGLPGLERSLRMAVLYELEARCWSTLFECTRTRVHWRAALAAEVGARQLARHWRRRAEMEARAVPISARLGGCVEIAEWAKRWQGELAGGAS